MPIVLRAKGYRVSFYEADLEEPPHVHVRKGSGEAKFWLDPIVLSRSRGYREHELNEIARLLDDHRNEILEAWSNEEAKRGNR
ncbi:MAG: DUF4160 domain-containing protein [Planctomycetota bacterium]